MGWFGPSYDCGWLGTYPVRVLRKRQSHPSEIAAVYQRLAVRVGVYCRLSATGDDACLLKCTCVDDGLETVNKFQSQAS